MCPFLCENVLFLKNTVSFSANRKILLASVSLRFPALVQMEQSYITGLLNENRAYYICATVLAVLDILTMTFSLFPEDHCLKPTEPSP